MQKLNKLKLIMLSPLVVASFISIIPIYFIYKSIDKILFKRDCIDLVFQRP